MELVEAQDYLIGLLGSAPTGDITSLNPDAQAARARLDDVSGTVQKKGWWFNTDYNVTMSPSIDDKEILLPSNVIKIIPQNNSIVQRGIKLYDSYNNTYQFEGDVVATRIVKLDWDLLPIDAQDLIRFTAGAELISSELEDTTKAAEVAELARTALLELKQAQMRVQRRNIFATPRVARAQAGVRPYRGMRGKNPTRPGG